MEEFFSDHVTLFFRSHDQNRTASDSTFQRQFYHSTGFDSIESTTKVNEKCLAWHLVLKKFYFKKFMAEPWISAHILPIEEN